MVPKPHADHCAIGDLCVEITRREALRIALPISLTRNSDTRKFDDPPRAMCRLCATEGSSKLRNRWSRLRIRGKIAARNRLAVYRLRSPAEHPRGASDIVLFGKDPRPPPNRSALRCRARSDYPCHSVLLFAAPRPGRRAGLGFRPQSHSKPDRRCSRRYRVVLDVRASLASYREHGSKGGRLCRGRIAERDGVATHRGLRPLLPCAGGCRYAWPAACKTQDVNRLSMGTPHRRAKGTPSSHVFWR